MRFLTAAAAFALLAGPVLAQTSPATPPAATPGTPLPDTAAPAAQAAPPATAPAAPKKTVAHRPSLQKRFDTANVTHDGHLTKDQATAAKWSYVTKNFAAIDSAKKGYVTVEDIRAYSSAQRASHKKPVPATPATTPATNS